MTTPIHASKLHKSNLVVFDQQHWRVTKRPRLEDGKFVVQLARLNSKATREVRCDPSAFFCVVGG